ncbi:hypothetical protein B0T24DRAFT_533570 [Lasiosphaeria ovina]|uniref:Enoyl reductase (ER) domain-containing protein n=1 Tax=Lasiosphaeria ovina TaxID=92902 RepID=A0AAE0K461_9PEZI|nr:hypothetical protein B0T24DRAFT_533570 [Lasiosphaeria ovina]
MKAWVVARRGAPRHALQFKTDVAVPAAPRTGSDLLVKVSHAAINPADAHFINVLPTWLPFRRAPTPGMDFAGEVVAAGPAAPPELAAPGTRVAGAMGVAQVAFGKGSLAEYVLVPAHLVAPVPAKLSDAEAAGLFGIAGQTAEIVTAAAAVGPGKRALVNGASGGVGSLVVQILKAQGAEVFGVCSGANVEMVRRLGADEVIDYRTNSPLEAFLTEKFATKPLDVIIDCAGSQPLFNQSPKYLQPAGRFLTIVGGRSQGVVPFVQHKLLPVLLGGTPRRFDIIGLSPAGAIARQVAKLVEDGSIKEAPTDSVFPFEEVVEAMEKLATKRAKGKIVIKVAA